MTNFTVPLVGAHFHPPAKWVLPCLPAGIILRLEPDPGNPYDEFAIRVLCASESIPVGQHEMLAEALVGTAFELADVLAAGEIWLGFVAKKVPDGTKNNLDVHELAKGPGWASLQTRLHFDLAGKPVVWVSDENAKPQIGETK